MFLVKFASGDRFWIKDEPIPEAGRGEWILARRWNFAHCSTPTEADFEFASRAAMTYFSWAHVEWIQVRA